MKRERFIKEGSLSLPYKSDCICDVTSKNLVCKDFKLVQKQEVLQQAIVAGIESTDAGSLDMQAIKEKARASSMFFLNNSLRYV